MPASLELVVLAVSDVARATHFYTAVFGWKREVDAPVYAELPTGAGARLGLYVRMGFARNPGAEPPELPRAGAISPAELYVRCDDAAGTLARVPAAGGRLLSPLSSRDWGETVGYAADPDGHVVAVAQRR